MRWLLPASPYANNVSTLCLNGTADWRAVHNPFCAHILELPLIERRVGNRRFKEDVGATFPLLSDFKRKTVMDYGIFDKEGGYGTRATFTIDKDVRTRYIEQGKDAIDPTAAYQSCSALPG